MGGKEQMCPENRFNDTMEDLFSVNGLNILKANQAPPIEMHPRPTDQGSPGHKEIIK